MKALNYVAYKTIYDTTSVVQFNTVFCVQIIQISPEQYEIGYFYFHCFNVQVVELLNFLHQPLHTYKIYKILHIKTLKTPRHVSVLRPSSGSYIFLAKIVLEIVTY